jgi:Rrf2 family nitric oxide-sensitive transcriptional repressor
MAVLARRDSVSSVSTRSIAEELQVSADHLSKVMQRLAKNHLVQSTRGPNGGYRLARSPNEISMLDIYESMEGPSKPLVCVFDTRKCVGKSCIFGDMIANMEGALSDFMKKTRLADVVQKVA